MTDNRATASREFRVAPPDMRKAALLPVLGFIAAIAGVAVAAREQAGVLWLLPLLALIAAVIARGLRRQRVALGNDGALLVQAGLHQCRVPLADLDASRVRIVDLGEHTELRPFLKTFGTALPGYKAGHFRLRDRSRAFVLVTDPSRVLVLTERSGRRLLLSLAKPQELLDIVQGRDATRI